MAGARDSICVITRMNSNSSSPYCSWLILIATCFITSSTIVPVFSFHDFLLSRLSYRAQIRFLSSSFSVSNFVVRVEEVLLLVDTAVDIDEVIEPKAAVAGEASNICSGSTRRRASDTCSGSRTCFNRERRWNKWLHSFIRLALDRVLYSNSLKNMLGKMAAGRWRLCRYKTLTDPYSRHVSLKVRMPHAI